MQAPRNVVALQHVRQWLSLFEWRLMSMHKAVLGGGGTLYFAGILTSKDKWNQKDLPMHTGGFHAGMFILLTSFPSKKQVPPSPPTPQPLS